VRVVYIDDASRDATVVVPDDQLALAIGKEVLNARLAARLTVWKVDIVSDTEFAQQEAEAAFGGDGDADFSGRCAAILANGKRCPNTTLPGSRFCGVPAHQELAKIEAQTGEYAPGTVTPTSAEPEDAEDLESDQTEGEPEQQEAATETSEPVTGSEPVLEQTTELPVAEQNVNGPVEPAAYEPEGTAPAA
jgi:transcription termination/antitermination protein NusA